MADHDSRSGKTYATDGIVRYLDDLHAPHDSALASAFAAPAIEGMPAIQVGASDGKLLELLVRMTGARRIVEIGTLAGYSALRLARALPVDGRLWTIELDARHASVARARIAEAGLNDRVEVLVGSALEVLPSLEAHGPFDVVFIDADKEHYDRYGAWAARHLRAGGLLLGDNAYLFGRLLDESPAAAAMRRFHEAATQSFDTVCIPTPDGLLLGVKRA
jgi:caffeoyl-CoA O-methyltransferase